MVIASGFLLACETKARDVDVAVINAQVAALEHDLKLRAGVEFEGPPMINLLRADHGVLAFDSKTLRLHAFGADGNPSGSSAKQGAGPGEFLAVSDMFRFTTDTVVAYDPTQQRLTYFDSLGAYVGTQSLVGWPESRRLRIVGRQPNGEIIGLLTTMSFPNTTASIGIESATLLVGSRNGAPRVLLQLPVARIIRVFDAGNPFNIYNPLRLNRAFNICANSIAVVHDTVADMFDFDGRLMSTRALSVLGTEISSRAAAERIAQSVGYIQSASARREATTLLTQENVGSPRASAFVLTDASGSLWFSVAPRTFARYAVDGTRTALLKLNAPRFLLTANDSLMLVLRPESDSSAVGLELLRLPIKGRVTTSNAKVSACGRTIPF